MKLEEKMAIISAISVQLQDNVGNRLTHALAHGLLLVLDQQLVVEHVPAPSSAPSTMRDLTAPAQPGEPAADAGTPA